MNGGEEIFSLQIWNNYSKILMFTASIGYMYIILFSVLFSMFQTEI